MLSVLSPVAMPSAPVPRIADGAKTATIYGLLRDQQYVDAIAHLSSELSFHPKSRAALSLLGYAYHAVGDFQSAAQCYEQLCHLFPDTADYRFQWAQSLQKAGLYADALSVSQTLVNNTEWRQRVMALQAAIHFDADSLTDAASSLAQCEPDDNVMHARACLQYKEKKYEAAASTFTLVQSSSGQQPDITYALATCLYQQKQYTAALKLLTDHIERMVKLHPQLAVGARMDSAHVLSVGNSAALKESYLIEAFNLKAAIEYNMQSPAHAKESLLDMPPRDEAELDIVTLHNTALLHMDEQPAENLNKLQFVLQAGGAHFPREAFHNLLLFYAKYNHLALAADTMAENAHLTATMDKEVVAWLEAAILVEANGAEAYRRLEALGAQYIERLRKCTKNIQEWRMSGGADATDRIKAELKAYDATIEHYLPIVMTQCKIYWDRHNYEQVEKILRMNGEFVSEHDTYKLNVAHTLFMQESKYKDAIRYYEQICKKSYHSILSVQPSILANLCVSYIMCSENEEAEELMRLIEKEEEKTNQTRQLQQSVEAKTAAAGVGISTVAGPAPYHLCIVNLVIGTLYCSKGNFEFGVSRIIKSFEPLSAKLNMDTWYYAKKSILSVLEYAAKSMFVMKREFSAEIDAFLTLCEKEGKSVKVHIPGQGGVEGGEGESVVEEWQNNVTHEARMLKQMLYKLKD